jgi:pimeloyl-ACP methyl ester carboxylesterase
VARFARVVSYDRAYVGGSEPGPPVKLARCIEEMRHILQSAGARGPFVLVDHSFGGLVVRVYARRLPDEVGGLVLVEGTPDPSR